MKKSERLIKRLLSLMVLILSACAPVTQSVTSVAANVSNALGGISSVSYQTNAWDIVMGLSQEAMKIQPSSAHTFMSADKLSDTSLTLVATPVKGSAAITSLSAGDAKEIQVKVNCVEKEGYVEVTLSPENSGDAVARETVAKIIAQLDKMFIRHTAS